jgi:hypothetical protein
MNDFATDNRHHDRGIANRFWIDARQIAINHCEIGEHSAREHTLLFLIE